jgi:uncharacterized protein (DUF433 family)
LTASPSIPRSAEAARAFAARVRVEDIIEMLAGGSTRAEILADFPYLQDEDITAALEFAARAVDHPTVVTTEP